MVCCVEFEQKESSTERLKFLRQASALRLVSCSSLAKPFCGDGQWPARIFELIGDWACRQPGCSNLRTSSDALKTGQVGFSASLARNAPFLFVSAPERGSVQYQTPYNTILTETDVGCRLVLRRSFRCSDWFLTHYL